MLIPSRRILNESCPFYYPFGNTVVRDVLKDCRFVGDEIKVLFLGCGDLRNALKTAGNRKKLEKLDIHMNDLNQSVVARNILILKIISAESFDIENEEDVSFLWDIWYNAEWPESTLKRFQSVLKELLDNNLPDNVIIPKSSYSTILNTVWSSWSSFSSKIKSESDLFMKKIQKERKLVLFNGWHKLQKTKVDIKENLSSLFPKITDGYASYVASIFEGFQDSFKQKVQKEARRFFSTGTCTLKIGIGNVCVNPTMLDPTTNLWQVHYQLCPFDGYLPMTREELDTSDDNGILIRTCQKKLHNLVAGYKKRIEGIKMFFHLEHALELCLSETTLVFNVIDCSNLADHVGLIHLINACEKILADTPGCMLITETMTWRTVAPSVLEYIEQLLSCPMSMIPTIYGLKLTNHVELGTSIPTNNLLHLKIIPIRLYWEKALFFENVVLSSSPELSSCLNQLAKMCYLPQENECSINSMQTISNAEMLIYTPLTFSYVLNSMIARVGGNPLCFRPDDMELSSVYNLNRRTLEAWKNHEIPLKFTSTLQRNLLNRIFSAEKMKGGFRHTSPMRLVLVPLFVFQYGFSDPGIHVIDNFQLDVEQTAEGEIETARVSFLLMPGHGLENTHCAYLFDVTISSLPIFIFEPVAIMQVEKYCQPYPFSPRRSQLPLVTKELKMRVDSCIESLDKYTLKIGIESRKNISGLKVTPSQCLPCESVHGLTLSLDQPNGIEPLALQFPFPILVNGICATLHRKNRSINLVLKKALFEPWPYEFQTKPIWIADNLKPWKDGSEVTSRLTTHLGIQLKMSMLRSHQQQSLPLSKMSALNEVRALIQTLMETNQEFVSVQRKDSTQSPNWYLRVHQPVRTSPLGSPILLLSAVDHLLVENLTSQGKLNRKECKEDFTRIFESMISQKNANGMLTIWMYTSEEEQLLRYVLRLNSTKIKPTTWQKENLPQGENSSWLATFVSPLYDDCPMDQESLDTMCKSDSEISKPTSCAACKKVSGNLKRCSRCRTAFYCSVECQRGHWTEHKNVCNKSQK